MKKKIAVISIFILLTISSTFTVMASTSLEKIELVIRRNNTKQGSTTLITEQEGGNRVFEVDNNDTIVWAKIGLKFPVDAERLANDNTLITEIGNNRVIEVDKSGTIVWEKTGLNAPVDAERLTNGNTLIADTYNFRVIEVDNGGNIVWQTGSYQAFDAERLTNGNTLIADTYNFRVIEVNYSGNIVWEYNSSTILFDVERLANGNTLIAEFGNNRVIEVDISGNIVWKKDGLKDPWDVERLVNGNTLIAEFGNNRVIEVYSSGTIVWQRSGLNEPVDVERTYDGQPDAPTIIGLIIGRPGVEYDYKFTTIDSEGHDVYYWIDWGDGSVEQDGWIGPYRSGEKIDISHSWEGRDTFILKAKAKDIFDLESEWGYLILRIIPRSRETVNFLFHLFFERFPLLEVFLRAVNL